MLMLGAILGFSGGIIRAIFGLLKKSPKKEIEWKRLFLTLLGAGAIGLFAAIFTPENLKMSLLAGYGGTDFIEGLWKIKMRDVTI